MVDDDEEEGSSSGAEQVENEDDQDERESNNGADNEDDDNQDDDEEEEEIPANMGPDDPRRMKVKLEEQWWALTIKDTIEETPGLDNLSDFMYAQLAIICQDDAEEAVSRAWALQYFRQEYDILDSREDGRHTLQQMVELMPRFLLSFQFSPTDGAYSIVHDNNKVDTTVFNTEAKSKFWFAGSYYIAHAAFPDLESVRRGVISLAECEGMDLTKKQNFRLIQKLFDQFISIYPFKGSLLNYHTGVVYNIMAALLKKVLPAEVKDRFQTGLIFESRLDAVFLVPNAEAATQRILQNMEKNLATRFVNERTFSLEDDTAVAEG